MNERRNIKTGIICNNCSKEKTVEYINENDGGAYCPVCGASISIPFKGGEIKIKVEGDNHFEVQDVFEKTYKNIINMEQKKSKMENTILILSALHKELDALFNYLGSPFELEKIVDSNRVYYRYQKSDGLNIVCAAATDMGQLNSAILAKDAIEKWKPQKVLSS